MKPIDTIISTGLRNAATEDLIEELNDRFSEAEISGIEFRMNRQIQNEAETSAFPIHEIKRELAKHWLGA